jgi:hypothetical protein
MVTPPTFWVLVENSGVCDLNLAANFEFGADVVLK